MQGLILNHIILDTGMVQSGTGVTPAQLLTWNAAQLGQSLTRVSVMRVSFHQGDLVLTWCYSVQTPARYRRGNLRMMSSGMGNYCIVSLVYCVHYLYSILFILCLLILSWFCQQWWFNLTFCVQLIFSWYIADNSNTRSSKCPLILDP